MKPCIRNILVLALLAISGPLIADPVLDYYGILGIKDTKTDQEAIRTTCLKKKRETGLGKQEIDLIEQACSILTDPAKRKEYDLQRERQGVLPLAPKDPDPSDPNYIEKKKSFLASSFEQTDVFLFNLLGNFLSELNLPQGGTKIFNTKLGVKDMKFIAVPPSFRLRKGLGFTGTITINNLDTVATVIIAQDALTRKAVYSLSVELPQGYKISDLLPKFKKMDSLSLPKSKIVLSTFDYTDPQGFPIRKGFNFIAFIDLTGPMKPFGELEKLSKKLKSVVVEHEPVRLHGTIPKDITEASFEAEIPIRFGIDFTKIPKVPSSFSKIINQITTDNLEFHITPPPRVEFRAETGVRLKLGTQTTPIRLSAFGVIESATLFSLGIRMRNLLDLGFIALGNAGIQLDFDTVYTPIFAALGVPLSGIGINGEIDVGKGEELTRFLFSGGISFKSEKGIALVLETQVENLNFSAIVALLSKIAAKAKIGKEIPPGKIPIMRLPRLGGYLVLEKTRIAQRDYYPGFGFNCDAQLFDKTFGLRVDIRHKELQLSAEGYIPVIEYKKNNKLIFRLSGSGYEGVRVRCFFDALNLPRSSFGLDTLLEIPAVKLSQAVSLDVSARSFRADIAVTYAGFTALFGLFFNTIGKEECLKQARAIQEEIDKLEQQKRNFPETRPEFKALRREIMDLQRKQKECSEMFVSFGFRDDFEGFLSKQAKPALEKLKNKASVKLAGVDAKIAELSAEIEKVVKKGVADTQAEIQRTKEKIEKSKTKIKSLNALKAECKKKKSLCLKTRKQLAVEKAKVAAYEIYLKALLKPGKKVIKGTAFVAKVTKALSDAQLLKKTVTGILNGINKGIDGIIAGLKIFKVLEAIGEFSAKDISEGKLPRLISLRILIQIPDVPDLLINLHNLQFDFKNPVESAGTIATRLFEGIQFTDDPRTKRGLAIY